MKVDEKFLNISKVNTKGAAPQWQGMNTLTWENHTVGNPQWGSKCPVSWFRLCSITNGGTENSPSRKNSHLGQIGPFHVWWTEQNRDSSQIFPRRVCQRSLATLSTRLDWLDGWCLEDYKYTNTKYTNTHIQNTQIQTYKIHKYTHTKTQSLCQRSGHSVDMVGLLGWVVFGGFLLVCLEDSSSSLANNSFLSAILLLCPLRFKNWPTAEV